MIEVRCGECGQWIGESPAELVLVEVVDRGSDATVEPPRDIRRCPSCKLVSVFVARASLDGTLAGSVG